MTRWSPDLAGRAGPRYRAIAEALAEDVETGRLAPGARLPAVRALAHQLGVTVGTVSRAYAEVQRLGLLDGHIGRGTFIRDAGLPGGRPGGRLSNHDASRADSVDLSLNYPPSSSREVGLIGAALGGLARSPELAEFLGYPQEAGHPAHLDAAAAWLRLGGIAVPPERVALTAGVQHALTATLAAVCEPNDTVLAEALTYPGIRGLAIMQHLQLKGVAMDAHGMMPEAFDAACRTRRVRALYTIPTLHNPTCVTMPVERRREIAAIAARHDVLVIEDDIYGFMVPGMPPPIVSLAPERTVYLTGTSKNLSPGLRVGFAVAPERLVPRIAAMVRATMWMPAPPMVEVFRHLVESGDGSRIVAARQAEAEARQRLAAAALTGFEYRAHPHATHLWLQLPEPWAGRDLAGEARQRGVLLLAAEAFALRLGEGGDHTRLCLGLPPGRTDLTRGLTLLTAMLRENPDLQWRYF